MRTYALRIVAVALFAMMLSGMAPGTANAQEYTDIKRLGTSQALCEPITTRAELQDWFRNNRATVLAVLRDANWEGNPEDLFRAVANGEFSETRVPVGTRMLWMGRQVEGVPNASRLVRWAGDQPIVAFELEITSNGKIYDMIIPKVCCNLSLLEVREPLPPASPDLSLSATCAGEPLTVMASSMDGEVTVTVTDPEGETLQPRRTADGNWVVDTTIPGRYIVEATAQNANGTSGTTRQEVVLEACPVAEVVAPAKSRVKPYIGPFVGYENRTRDLCNCVKEVDAALAGLLGGVAVPIAERADFFAQIGGAANFEESKWSALFADVGVDWRVGEKGFLGAGVGVWDITDSGQRDGNVFVHGGVDTPWTFQNSPVQWFAEGRFLLDEDDVPDENNDFVALTGLRMFFGNGGSMQ